MSSNQIGILGGSFDPVHNGHLAIAQLVRDYLDLNRIVFIPAGNPPHKSERVTAPARDRLIMLQKALTGSAHFGIWEGELNRPGKSYTVDTLAILKRELPNSDFFFIIGSDSLQEFTTWHRYREICTLATLTVVSRPGYSVDPPSELSGCRIVETPSPEWGLSSSMLRSMLAKGLSCNYLIPSDTLEHIRANTLYSGSERSSYGE